MGVERGYGTDGGEQGIGDMGNTVGDRGYGT